MKVLLWQMRHTDAFDQLVLWDGYNTYWDDEMKPSPHSKVHMEEGLRQRKWHPVSNSRFILIGEL